MLLVGVSVELLKFTAFWGAIEVLWTLDHYFRQNW